MSHDSGFRRGGRTVAPPPSRKQRGGRASRKFERNITKRFRAHEQAADADVMDKAAGAGDKEEE